MLAGSPLHIISPALAKASNTEQSKHTSPLQHKHKSHAVLLGRCHALPVSILSHIFHTCGVRSATVGVVTETNAEKAIEELKAYEVSSTAFKPT